MGLSSSPLSVACGHVAAGMDCEASSPKWTLHEPARELLCSLFPFAVETSNIPGSGRSVGKI